MDLLLGEHADVGDVLIWNDDSNLYVRYMITHPYWRLNKTSLHIAHSFDDIPRTTEGNPSIDQFHYNREHADLMEYTYTLPLSDMGTDLHIATHAVVFNTLKQTTIDVITHMSRISVARQIEKVTTPIRDTRSYERIENKATSIVEKEPKEEAGQDEETLLTENSSRSEGEVARATEDERHQAVREVPKTRRGLEQEVTTLGKDVASIEEPGPVPGSYTVNLASFRKKARACRLVEELRQKGLESFYWEVNLPEKGKWYRVAVGNFSTLEHAKDFVTLQGLKDGYSVFITRIPDA
jgi:cell division septation protein DedD